MTAVNQKPQEEMWLFLAVLNEAHMSCVLIITDGKHKTLCKILCRCFPLCCTFCFLHSIRPLDLCCLISNRLNADKDMLIPLDRFSRAEMS